MTQSDTPEYAWNPQTTVCLTEPSPNLCLTTDELSPDTVLKAGQNIRYYEFHYWTTNISTIGPLISYDIILNEIIYKSEPDWK